jgi:S-adenosylmethionine decarboxylase
MDGLHLTADLRDCATQRAPMTDAAALRALCLDAVARAGLQPVGELFHRFATRCECAPGSGRAAPAGGVTGVVLLAESHVAVHTWPELDAVTLDVYVCNYGADNAARAHALIAHLIDAFGAANVERHALLRGARAAGTAR